MSAALSRQGSGFSSWINLCVIANASKALSAAIFFSMSHPQAQKNLLANTTVLLGKEFHYGFSVAQVENGASRHEKISQECFLHTLYVVCE